DRMRAFLRDRVAAFAALHHLSVAPRLVFDGYTAEAVSSPRRELDHALQAALAAAGLPPPHLGPATGAPGQRPHRAEGSECLLYGPGAGFNPHRADEHYRLDDLPRIVTVLLNLALTWCSVSEG